jgi:hypothetical protein
MSDAKREPQGPPKDVTPSELWLAMMAVPVPHVKVDMPIKEPVFGKSLGEVAIVPLSPEDLMISRKVAGEWASKMTGESPKHGEETPAYFAIMASEAAVQILWRALRDPNDPTLKKPAIPTAALIRRAPFTDDIITVLMRLYTRACVTTGPIIATMTEEEMNAWLDALEEGGAAFPFLLLSQEMQSELLTYSVARYRKYVEASGSRGPLPDAATGSNAERRQSDPLPTMPEDEQPPDVSADDLPIPK